jgi:hypothetical protein
MQLKSLENHHTEGIQRRMEDAMDLGHFGCQKHTDPTIGRILPAVD